MKYTLIACLLLVGCADPLSRRHTSAPDSNISNAAAISDRIDDKAVIVAKYLKTH